MKTKKNNKSKEQKLVDIKEVELKKLSNWEKVIENVPQVIDFFMQRLLKHEAPIAKSTLWGFIIIIGIILGGALTLVILDKLDSSGFTFIVGIILGYFLSAAKMFIRREEG
ncbi:hypothetical protein KAW96_00405 [candidate division WOR-3 bacterium]|nr:hypothetical protein [candidate division WOR-3 bacterium]